MAPTPHTSPVPTPPVATTEADRFRGRLRGPSGYLCCAHCSEDVVHDVPKDGHEIACQTCEGTSSLRQLKRAEARLQHIEDALDPRTLTLAWLRHLGYTEQEISAAEAWDPARAQNLEQDEPESGDCPAVVEDLHTAAAFVVEIVDAAYRKALADADKAAAASPARPA